MDTSENHFAVRIAESLLPHPLSSAPQDKSALATRGLLRPLQTGCKLTLPRDLLSVKLSVKALTQLEKTVTS